MKIYINHSFLFNIDSMLRCFSSEIDQMWSGEIDQMWSKCGEYKQLFILQLVFFIYFVYCISIMRVILNKAVTKKKSCTWGAAECVTQGGERGRLIYIYTEGGGGHYILCKQIIQINVQKTIISALGMAISFLGQKGVTVFLQEIQGEDIRKNQ